MGKLEVSWSHLPRESDYLFLRWKLSGMQGGGRVVSQLLMAVNTKALDHISVLSDWFYSQVLAATS